MLAGGSFYLAATSGFLAAIVCTSRLPNTGGLLLWR